MAQGVPVRHRHAKLPLKVLVHAGGVLQDATISGQSLQGLRRVLAPKVSASDAFGGSGPGVYVCEGAYEREH